ncbi:hypothetical protein A2643_01360 [Candidatus Nomurabacteria bacterium RIFCSPHIGHO2_01_FULL_39_220]|uniref:Uncharacterized protein n=1 Tax=Candidatus Nomurabacteria bacterium RIFCSPLOWO2_02_FULL_40_67 TaxID=1801787 RepID=A0A1F6Y413_9BACT|nr:MAG: hypothetical protein A2643_01360 [Candidatus Nomurabacteria bacterium RIFCSPHIGHO2_01_FULL_39_220]OGI72833.1 MAG: hypothetical protein A2W56_01870 [Candidatus Nomurabacteria bacterium RIFCSPHIGHO2_02_41_18]OGI81229.1 MAG: hypothetical protein A3E03_00840 [Candidatus Nomurabacteria bacterium RIFCSPHIGHO2_12_FULL_40_64]OGI91680.1 MAG: hypothetical protein A3A06_02095 [Candidatus Nomurabacteria bacterium RIFCSPLOWO2_01_FULL_41_220]OGJ01039.1 MAG: hypothetical protein A3I23_01910 [Candidatu
MMYFLLILFFASLTAIILMISRKLVIMEHDQIVDHEEVLFEVPFLKEIKHLMVKNMRKHGYTGLVTSLRFYVKSTNFLKDKYQDMKTKVKNKIQENNTNSQNKEISKFLKIIGDYKQKIRDIKNKIKKEENL